MKYQEHVEPLFYSVADVCMQLSVGRTFASSLIKRGVLKSKKVGRRRLVCAQSIRTFASHVEEALR
jgi:excisionase family DNA binding protein